MSDAHEATAAPPDEGTDQARKDAIRRLWLTEHGGEAVRLEAAVVAEIAYRLVEAGLQPTVDAIRYVNGGQGSPNVIHPAVRQFFRADLRRRWGGTPPPEVPGVPPALVELWGQCVRDAQRAADSTLEAPRAELARLRVAIEQRATEVEATAEQQRAELVAIKEQAVDLSRRLDRAEKAQATAVERAHAAESSLVSAQAEIKAQREAHKTLQAQASAERTTLAKERDRWRAQAEEARLEAAVLSKAQEHAESRLTEQLARAATQQALEHDLRGALATANGQIDDLRRENQQIEALTASASAERDAAYESAAKAEQRASISETRLQAANDRIMQIQADLDTARATTLDVARIQGELKALREQNDRLGQELATMQSQLIRRMMDPAP
ncbi:DNA-binding protein [Metallibacterium scheffleri]|uniref:DNA-binding protein n=1 Tax=Metallibacterium scheffleri TaxID=993689 RepID=UPI001447FBC8|nr:DNA-binding protein [Metallibacterium scheffleri]